MRSTYSVRHCRPCQQPASPLFHPVSRQSSCHGNHAPPCHPRSSNCPHTNYINGINGATCSLLRFVAERMTESPHLEYYLRWTLALVQDHGRLIRQRPDQMLVQLSVGECWCGGMLCMELTTVRTVCWFALFFVLSTAIPAITAASHFEAQGCPIQDLCHQPVRAKPQAAPYTLS